MRKVLILLTVVLFCGCLSLSYAEDNLKVGFINLKKIADSYEKLKDAEKELQKELDAKREQGEKLTKEIKSLREKIDLLKDKQKEKKQRELDQKVKELQDLNYEARTSLREKSDEKMREVSKDIKAVVQEYGQSRNYNIIFDSILVHYEDGTLDVTKDIIKTLNQRYKK